MKLSKSRHNIFSKVDHDKVFIEKNYNLQIQNNNNLNEDLPPLRLDVRKKIAYEQLKVKLQQKTSVITHAKCLDNHLNEYNENDDYDDDNISIKSNYSEELENFKKSYEIFNTTDNLLDELGYIGQIKEELTDDDSDDHSENTFTSHSEGKRKKFKSTIDVHNKFMNDASMKGTLREIKSVGSLKKLASSKDLALKSQQLELLSSPNKVNNTNNQLESNNSFLFLSKLTSNKLSIKTHAENDMKSATDVSPYGNSSKGYVVSPVGYTCNNNHSPITSSSSNSNKLPLFGKPISPSQLVNSSLSIKTHLAVNKSLDTKGSILNVNNVSNNAIIRTSTKIEAAHIDETTGMSGSNSSITLPPKFHVPAIQAIHGKNKPFLQKIDKLFHRITSQKSDPRPIIEISPSKEVLTKESLFAEHLMKTNVSSTTKDEISDEMLKNLLQASSTTDSLKLNHKSNTHIASAMLDKLDCILERHDEHTTTTAILARNQPIRVTESPTSPSASLVSPHTHIRPQQPQQYPPINSSFSKPNNNSSSIRANQSFYEIDVHSLNLPNINGSNSNEPLSEDQISRQNPMICLYSPIPANKMSSLTSIETKHNNSSSGELLLAGKQGIDSPLLNSKHSSSFNNPGTMYVPIIEEAQYNSSSSNQLYKQALNDGTQRYISILQNISNDPGKHVLLNENITSDIFNEEDNDSTSQKYIPRSVTNTTSDRGMYSIDKDQHRNFIPNDIPDLLDEGYIYQHATNSYVHKDDINHSKYGQYQRSQYISPWSKYQQKQWNEMEDKKIAEDFDPFSDRQFNQIEINTAGISVPVIYIPGNGNPVAEPPPIIHQHTSSYHQYHPQQQQQQQYGNITLQGRTALEPGDVVSDTNYNSVRSTMLYPNNLPVQSIHHHQQQQQHQSSNRELVSTHHSNINNHRKISSDPLNADDSTINTFGNNNSTSTTTKTNKEVPSSPVVNRIKNQINDYINNLEYLNSNQYNNKSLTNINNDNNNKSSDNSNNLTNNDNIDIAKAKLWSKLNNRYSGDKEGVYNMKIKIKKYVFDGIKENTQIENKYMSDLDDWF